jgi:hypothetical protein
MADDFGEVYARLREIMLEAAPGMTINRDEPGALELRTPDIDPKTKQPGWFGTVTIKKGYVAFHLMPLYLAPHLASEISPALAKRRQGKTCFNFKKIDDVLLEELSGLARRCAVD